MSSKNISITEDVYRELLAYKSTKESFTETLRKLLKRKKRIYDFFGAWGTLSKEEEKRLINAQKKLRNSWKLWDKEFS
ncbi:MAG: antitoxin VapB family protein [Thermoplasmatales archaeon]|nr:antitoxin VapB family protein [Candidatus Thermoplasmatota archaeon]MCG2826468.1 antitoxin VapB family protein [Thermoplasmatales archaeon]